MIGYEIAIDEGVEIEVNRFVLDERLRDAKNWTADDMRAAYLANGEYNDETVNLCPCGESEAHALFDDACRECKSDYYFDGRFERVRFDVAFLYEVELELNGDSNYEVVDVIRTLDMYIQDYKEELK